MKNMETKVMSNPNAESPWRFENSLWEAPVAMCGNEGSLPIFATDRHRKKYVLQVVWRT
jgi:hypothetical protein